MSFLRYTALAFCCCLFPLALPGAGAACERPPALPVAGGPSAGLSDDAGYAGLDAALAASERYLRQVPGLRFSLCGETVTTARLLASVQELRRVVRTSPAPADLARIVEDRFTLCQAAGNLAENKVLATGYYEPFFDASLRKTARFRYPLYRLPPDLISIPPQGENRAEVGRREGAGLVPYWTRAEIEKEGHLAGHELVYLADPVDAFILHVQGSGRVRLPDGTVRRVQYAGKNGQAYASIGRLMVEEGLMTLSEVTMPKIVQYLKAHPGERERIMHHNKSYVFFRWGAMDESGPLGNLGEPLTPGRSVALDQRCYPPGIPAYVVSRKPRVNGQGEVIGWEPLHRFVVNQDTGSAITGPGRLDFFWGNGLYAEVAAGHMKHPASLYFLIKNK